MGVLPIGSIGNFVDLLSVLSSFAEEVIEMAYKRPLHEELYSCLGHVISLRRKRLGLSQQELAEEANVDRAFLSSVECGKRNPSFGTVASIASGLKMRFSRLVTKAEQCTEERQAAD
jgi:DNA-binding XRE family transcriptional regulator